MANGVRRFRLAVLALAAGLALVVPGTAAAAPAQPQQGPFGMSELKPCHPDTTPPYEPVTLRPAATETTGIPGYLMPAGMSYFGIGTDVGSPYLKNNLLVGPSSFTCVSDGYDQTKNGGWAQLNSPTDPAAAVFTWYYAKILDQQFGGQEFSMCQALTDAGLTAQFDDYKQAYPEACDQYTWSPSSAFDIPVARTRLSIGYAIYPAGQQIVTTPAHYPTLEVSIFQYADPLTGASPSQQALVTSIGCSLPFNQAGFCTDTLSAWVQTQLTNFYGATEGQATEASAALRAQIQLSPGAVAQPAGSAAPAPSTAGGCTAPLNEGIESKLAELPAKKPIPLQAARYKSETPAEAALAISVGFSPLEFHLCEEGLLGASIDPGEFTAGQPSLTVRDEDQQHHQLGPFVYDAQGHGWEKNATIPPGQDLQTHYNAAFRVELGPQVSTTLDPAKIAAGSAPDISLNLISVILQAKPQEVTLVKSPDGRELLQMVGSPQLTFTLEISPKDVEEEVRDDEAAGDKQALDVVKDASEEIAQEDSLVMADEIDATARRGLGFLRGCDGRHERGDTRGGAERLRGGPRADRLRERSPV